MSQESKNSAVGDFFDKVPYSRILLAIGVGVALAAALDNIAIGIGVGFVFLLGALRLGKRKA